MRYSQVESALVKMHGVEPDKLGAFQARIRHLRRFDCPPIVKGERGAPAEYTREHAVELALALALSNVMMPPRWAAGAAKFWTKNIEPQKSVDRLGPIVGQIVLRLDADISEVQPVSIFRGSLNFPLHSEHGPVVTLVNISAILDALDVALAAEGE